jgi:hypothetical protein
MSALGKSAVLKALSPAGKTKAVPEADLPRL